jgi:Zn-dependent protease with chaperone function
MTKTNPTENISVNFLEYAQKRRTAAEAHIIDGIPDYAYGMDYVLRQKIHAIPGVFKFFKALTSQVVPFMKQKQNLQSIKVGPSQFPDVHEQVVDCAKILGIGIPMVFIEHSPAINAYTIASEDDAPLIILTSALVDKCTPGEIRYVIGHECGHIHNNHGIYTTAANIILGSFDTNIPVIGLILNLASLPLHLAFQSWSRAGEVTSDRAGIICANDVKDAISLTAKFLYGGMYTRSDLNIDAVLQQYEMLKATPVRLLELDSTHPLPVRRIFAQKEFMNSEVFYKWRGDLKKPGMELIGKQELDMRCEKYISVIKNEEKGGKK